MHSGNRTESRTSTRQNSHRISLCGMPTATVVAIIRGGGVGFDYSARAIRVENPATVENSRLVFRRCVIGLEMFWIDSPSEQSESRSEQSIANANLQKNNTNKYCYKILGLSICNITLGKPFARVCFAQIFCTDFCPDFLRGFFARFFCTDFLHGFFAEIFCTMFCPIFLRGFLRGLFARIVCTGVCTDFCTGLLHGVPKHLLGSAKISPRKSPGKFAMLEGPSGKALASLTRPESPRTGWVAGAPTEKVAIPVDLGPNF